MGDWYSFRAMDEADAREVAGWRYEPPYGFYDLGADPADLAEILDAERREDVFFSALDGSDLVGFLCFGSAARVPGEDYPGGDLLDVGLGLRPESTGRGLGLAFLEAGLEFARRRFAPGGFRLSVASFNERAIRVYRRAGFRETASFVSTSGERRHFIVMVRP